MEFFKEEEWYLKTDSQLQSRRHQIVEAISHETFGTLLERHRYTVRVIGFWDPQDDDYDFDHINRFEMILPDFNRERWSKISTIDKNKIMMDKFKGQK